MKKYKKCKECGSKISPPKTKYCSVKCKLANSNKNVQNYTSQRKRGVKRKLELIKMMGGACQKCGYNKNISALCFHHIDADIKSFELDTRSLSNNKRDIVIKEAQKCVLLCSNCHAEEHNPLLDSASINSLLTAEQPDNTHYGRAHPKIKWPEIETLMKRVLMSSLSSVAKSLKITPEAISKHLKKHGKKIQFIRQIS